MEQLTAQEKRYPVITLCGSIRFKDAFMEARQRLTAEGCIVMGPELFGSLPNGRKWDDMDVAERKKVKDELAKMHRQRIDMSDGIFVVNVGGYIGESTEMEIRYAVNHGKSVTYLEPI